ncbi:MAG: TonB-dependent receptor, partial [Pseudomonadota bacterium]
MKLVSTVSYAALLMSLGLAPMSAQAQDDDTGAEAFDLGTIVITARRTEEAIEDVPGSVVVATDEDLKGANIKRTDDLLLQFPNVNFTDGTTTTDLEISIRGLSDVNGAASTGPVNGIFLDGVLLNPTGSNLAINPRLLDLERVEVAFGPQGTAFGRGTIGGAINYVPKKPTDELEYTLGYELGSRADGEVRAIANVPILPDGKLSARVVAFAAFDDGFVPSVTLDDDLETDDYGVRLSLRSQLTDRFSLDFSASFDQTDFDSTRTATVASIEADDPINENSFFTDNQVERFFSSLRGTYEFDAGTLTANLSHADSNLDGGLDGDFSSIDFLSSDLFTETESTALEFRFEGNEFDLPGALGTLSYNAGVSLSDSITNTDSLSNVGPDGLLILGPLPLPAPVILGILGGAGLLGPAGAELGSFNVVSTNEVENFSIYGDLRWKPIEPLELTAGLRWSRDRVRANSESTSFGLVATGFAPLGIPTVIPSEPFEEETETFSAFTPSASVRYEWTDDFSTYFLFSTGFRPGGFTSAGTLPITPFDEERAKNFEIGFRSSFLEN